jgi:hypothetical protein
MLERKGCQRKISEKETSKRKIVTESDRKEAQMKYSGEI